MASLRYNQDLTLLYNDTKKKALNNIDKTEPSPSCAKLHRKLHAQKDRLVTWGLEWSEETSDSIDESVARAGLTETVTSVLGNIKEVLEQADRLSSSCGTGPNKAALYQDRYQDLLRDLTSSVDILYDLSATRRAIARGTHPKFGGYSHEVAKHGLHPSKIPFDAASFASSELTLVNTQFSRPTLSPYAGLPANINPNAVLLPVESPPPYDHLGIPMTTRMMARLSKSLSPESVQNVFKDVTDEYVSVLVEFANFDSLYRETGVPPPLQRVERLAVALNQTSFVGSLRLLGYFEDPQQPRIGLVYDYRAVHNAQSNEFHPVTLLSLILTATKATRPVDISNATPFLEDRFRIALRIVEKVRDLHVNNYFHGNLHSESIVFLQQGQSDQLRPSELHRPVVSAFDMFSRNRIEYTDTSAASNITKHPDDGGGEIDEITAIRYDLYGLGLVLMEIGLWTPVSEFFKQKYSLKDFKLRLEKLYIPKLASKCGSLYLRAVQTCLRYADSDDVGRVGVDSVYESILPKLQRCCLLDENEPFEILQVPAGFVPDQSKSSESTKMSKKRRNVGSMEHTLSESALDLKAAEKASIASFPSAISSSIGPNSPILSMLNAKTGRANSTGAESVKFTTRPGVQVPASIPSDIESLPPAAHNTQHASRTTEIFPYSFREYRHKVMLIQSRWRERRRQKLETRRSIDTQPPQVQPEQPAVTSTNKCRIFPVRLPQSIVDQWHSDIGLRLSCIIERALKGSPESSSIDLVNVGHDPYNTRPTIIVTCDNTARVKAALKRKFQYDKSMFDLKVRQGRVALSKGKSKGFCDGENARRSHVRGEADESQTPMNPFWQQRPLCGASIGAYLPDHGHLEPVSFGGIIEVDDRQYGMSVHHMLEPPSDSETSNPSETDDEDTDHGALRSSAKTTKPDQGYTSDLSSVSNSDSDDDGYMSSDFESDVSDDETFGDKPGISASSAKIVNVTQPAFEDAVAENLHADDATMEELDEDHLASYKLGNVYASSGLRRSNHLGQRYEIDWALFELEPPRLQPYNLIQGGRRHCTSPPSFQPALKSPVCRKTYPQTEDWYPTAIASDTLANLSVHCLARTSGLKTGVIGPAMSFIKIKGRRTFSLSWSVVGDFGVGGDSGAWILDNATGSVVGHVLAERNGLTYICAMALLFEDIRQTLHAARIALPGPCEVGKEAKNSVIVALPARGVKVGKDVSRSKVAMRTGWWAAQGVRN